MCSPTWASWARTAGTELIDLPALDSGLCTLRLVAPGSSVDSNRTAGDLVIAEGVDYEIEAKGEVRLDKGFQVEKGAMFKVIPAAW